jgi:acetoin utilization deacetylase AcuC-like enzyme
LRPVRAFYSDHFVLPLPEGHRFPMAKYSRLRERVVARGLVPPDRLTEAPPAGWDDLRLVHTGAYVAAVAGGSLPADGQRRIGFPWSPAMVERSRRSVGATIAAARSALSDGIGVNLAGGTHHAFADRGEGYCVFNDVAIGARVLQRGHGLSRIAIVDCDVHQGNGTAAIFRDDASVFTFSMHGAHNFPFKKEESDLDVALEDGTGDEEYLGLLARHLDEVLRRHEPEFVFYLAGADPYEGDRLGRLKLSIPGLRARDELVLGRCRADHIPVAISMSGGYAPDLEAIVTIHANTVAVAAALARDTAPAPGTTHLAPCTALRTPHSAPGTALCTLHSALCTLHPTTSCHSIFGS